MTRYSSHLHVIFVYTAMINQGWVLSKSVATNSLRSLLHFLGSGILCRYFDGDGMTKSDIYEKR